MSLIIDLVDELIPLKGEVQVLKLKNTFLVPIKILDIQLKEELERFTIEDDLKGTTMMPAQEAEVLISCTKEVPQVYKIKNIASIEVTYI